MKGKAGKRTLSFCRWLFILTVVFFVIYLYFPCFVKDNKCSILLVGVHKYVLAMKLVVANELALPNVSQQRRHLFPWLNIVAEQIEIEDIRTKPAD